MKKTTLDIQGHTITMLEDNFLSLTDISKRFSDRPETRIQNWIRSRNTIELLGLWESLHNEKFNHIEFDVIRNKTGLNSFAIGHMESYNETLIHYQMSKEERFNELEKAANRQLEILYKMNQLPDNLLESPNLPKWLWSTLMYNAPMNKTAILGWIGLR